MNVFSTTGVAPFEKNNTQRIVSGKFDTSITPEGWAFSIWGLIYTWQALYLCYGVSTIFRPDVPNVMSPLFCTIFIVSRVANITWLVLFAQENIGWSAVDLFICGFLLYACLFVVYKRYGECLNELESSWKKDLWAVRLLLHNGLAINLTWVTIASLLNLTMTLEYIHEMTREAAGATALCLLLTEGLIWYVLENFVFEKYTRYTWTIWPTVIWTLSAVIDKSWDNTNASSIMTAFILCLVVVLFIIRLVFQIRRSFFGGKDAAVSEISALKQSNSNA